MTNNNKKIFGLEHCDTLREPPSSTDTEYENSKLYTSISEPPKIKCNKCDKETKRLIPIYEYADNMVVFNYKIIFYCKQCFYYYLHGVLE